MSFYRAVEAKAKVRVKAERERESVSFAGDLKPVSLLEKLDHFFFLSLASKPL